MARARKSPQSYQLDFLDKLKRLRIGETIAVPVGNDEIGGELLNILSKGLYTNPIDAIREYVQNSIDADADEVEIQVTGNSVYILDYGKGMDRNQLLQAREFGVSTKSIEQNVGFRGIGIYSGFDLCERLIIRSKIQGERIEHILEFEFKDMRDVLDAARKDPNRPVIPLAKLLSDNTYYRYEETSDQEKSFSFVQLEELSDNHIHRLSDIKEMHSYILRTLPIRFSPEFRFGDEIEEALREYVPGYKSARVILRIENAEPVVVEKPNIPNLEPPHKGFIYSKGKDVAYYWACLVSGSDAISSPDFEKGKHKEFAGIAYKVKGFTIGDRGVARRYIPRIPDWWTGEIYVTDTNVIPTSARDDFEAGPAKDALEVGVRELLNGQNNNSSLQKLAIKAQTTRAADRIINDLQIRFEKTQEEVETGDFDQFKVYAQLEEILRLLKRHKGKSSDKTKEGKLVRKVTDLQARVKKEVEQPTAVSERKREAGKAAMKSAEAQKGMQQNTEGEGKESYTLAAGPGDPEHEEQSEEAPGNLIDAIGRSGWSVAEEDVELIRILGEALSDILGVDSEAYLRLIKEIEERLNELIEEG